MSEMMKLEAEDPGGLRVVPGIPVGSTSELEQTQDSKDLMFPDFQIVVVKEEHCDLWSSNSDQQDPEPLDIKEEDEELWINQEVEQLLVKIEDEEKPQLSELHQIKTENDRKTEAPTSSSTEQMETESNEENCGGPEPDTNRDPECSYQQRIASTAGGPSPVVESYCPAIFGIIPAPTNWNHPHQHVI
ncbi:uncharacterized protein LOC124875352 isoform X6 [Girardinichthys multiradiatus]|uniref:uncharacterized protein LOC124875352 isoform X6 n=1 Tax=Girardinichthys multiradiatus TaxID=208333 RepID=UPI001FAE047D|nr:uncharacterized protein LOC124875352 isoform X6 [Girardinichthys multiradiatus]